MKKRIGKILLTAVSVIALFLIILNLMMLHPTIEYHPSDRAIRNTFQLSQHVAIEKRFAYKLLQNDMMYFPHLLFQMKTEYLIAAVSADAINTAQYESVSDNERLEYLNQQLVQDSQLFHKDWIVPKDIYNCKVYMRELSPHYDTLQFNYTICNESVCYAIINEKQNTALLVYDQSRA